MTTTRVRRNKGGRGDNLNQPDGPRQSPSVVPVDVEGEHPPPVVPVVRPPVPLAQGVTDAPAPQDARHLARAVDERVLAPRRHDDVRALKEREAARVVLALDELDGVVEVDVLAVEA